MAGVIVAVASAVATGTHESSDFGNKQVSHGSARGRPDGKEHMPWVPTVAPAKQLGLDGPAQVLLIQIQFRKASRLATGQAFQDLHGPGWSAQPRRQGLRERTVA